VPNSQNVFGTYLELNYLEVEQHLVTRIQCKSTDIRRGKVFCYTKSMAITVCGEINTNSLTVHTDNLSNNVKRMQ